MKYEMPKIEAIKFNAEDIIRTSGFLTDLVGGLTGSSVGNVNATDIINQYENK